MTNRGVKANKARIAIMYYKKKLKAVTITDISELKLQKLCIFNNLTLFIFNKT